MKHIRKYINVTLLLRIIGWLLLIEGAFMCIPAIVAFIYREKELTSFLIGIAGCLGSGFILMSLKPKSHDLGKRDAMMLTALVWVVFSLFGMIPYLVRDIHYSVADAFFDTMSSFTTTGLTVLPSIDYLPKSFIMWRCTMQWVGGMGIILFTLAVLPMLNYQGGMQMFNAEVTGITHDKLRPRVSSTAKYLWLMYIVLSCLLMGLLYLVGIPVFDAVCYGLTTVSTGGFSTSDEGIHSFTMPSVKILLCVFMLLGSINFGLLFQAVTGHFKPLKKNTVFKWFIGIIVVSSVIISLSILQRGLYSDWYDLTVIPLFQTISLISSTGIVEPGFSQWGAPALTVMIILIFMGGCAGSTSGGVKVDRIVVCFKNIRNEFFRIMHPNSVLTVRMNGEGTPPFIVQKAITFVFVYVLTIIGAAIALLFMGLEVGDAFFSALECISNAGVGVKLDGTPLDYASFPPAGKWLLSFVMLTGRLEIYTVLLLLSSTFWRR